MLHIKVDHSNNCQKYCNCLYMTYFAIICGTKKFKASSEEIAVLITYVTIGGRLG